MFNIVNMVKLINQSALFSVYSDNKPEQLRSNLAFNWVNIVSFDGNGDPIIPTSGTYKVYVKTSPETGFESADSVINAINTGGLIQPDGTETASFYGGILQEIKITPVDVVGAVSYKAIVRQVDVGRRPEIKSNMLYMGKSLEWVNVRSLTREEFYMNDGVYYTGATTRAGISVPDSYYSVVQTGDKYLIIEDAELTTNFANLGDGDVNISLRCYVEASNGNDWTFTSNGDVSTLGRALNADYINELPLSTIDRGVTINTLTGIPDYFIFQVDYFSNTLGNANTKSTDSTAFFNNDRKILIPPNSTVLFETLTTGTITGTLGMDTLFFTAEPE